MNQTKPLIEIIDYDDSLKDYVKNLNYAWIEKHFKLEKGDVFMLSNPKETIIDKGGYIFFAKANNEILGTASLIKISNDTFELGKMAVTENARGLGIGTILLKHCVDFSVKNNVKFLVLYSNTLLQSAIHLYRKFNFEEVDLEPGMYERANIKMIKNL